MHGPVLKQNPISAVSFYNLRNSFLSDRLSVIQNQYRRLVAGHPVQQMIIKYPSKRLRIPLQADRPHQPGASNR